MNTNFKKVIANLSASTEDLKSAVDSALVTVEDKNLNGLKEQIASYYPMIELQFKLIGLLELMCVDTDEHMSLENKDAFDSIINRINAISAHIKSESANILTELTSGVKVERLIH